MRLHYGAIPEEFDLSAEWRLLSEPGPKVAALIATWFVGLPSLALFAFAWSALGYSPLKLFNGFGLFWPFFIGSAIFVVLVVIREGVHLLAHPRSGASGYSVVGVMRNPLIFYAQYLGPLSRNRFLFILLLPFIVLSIIPLLMALSTELPPGFAYFLAFFSSLNALSSCADLYGAWLLGSQLKSNVEIRNNGWKSYWKKLS
jgi:hypothetical protein